MDIKNTSDVNNLNKLNNLNPASAQTTSNINNTSAIDSNEKDASNVTVNDLTQGDRHNLSITLTTLNEGIAASKIAQDALQRQEEVLNNVSNTLYTQHNNTLNEEEQNDLKREVVLSLQNFNEIAQNAKFNNSSLLNKDEHYLNIATSNSSFSIEIPNTTKISDNLITSFRQTDLNDPQSLNQLSSAFKESATTVSNSAKELYSVEKSLQGVARDTIEEQISNSSSNNINFGEEVLDFSKTNVTSQLGYLVSSQANTIQAQSVRLLS